MSEVTDKAVEKLTEGVEQLARAAAKVTPQAWERLCAYHRAVALTEIAVWAALLIVGILVFRSGLKIARSGKDPGGDTSAPMLLGSGILLAILTVALVGWGAGTVGAVVSPEVAAMHELLEAVR